MQGVIFFAKTFMTTSSFYQCDKCFSIGFTCIALLALFALFNKPDSLSKCTPKALI